MNKEKDDMTACFKTSKNFFGCNKVILTVNFNVTYSQEQKNCHVFDLEKLGWYTSR